MILITGAAGFIGSFLSRQWIGKECVGIDNFDPFYDASIKKHNLVKIGEEKPSFVFHEGDLLDRALLEGIFRKHDISLVVHLAAKAGVRPSLARPDEYIRANVEASAVLAETMRKFGVSKMVFASSSSVYGNRTPTPFVETASPDSMISPYAVSKRSAELTLKIYSQLYGFNIHCLRLFTVYGPSQRPDLAICKFMCAHREGEAITLFGDGSMARDYTYVGDIVEGIMASGKKLLDSRERGLYEIYNLGNSAPVTLRQLIESIGEVTGIDCPIIHSDIPPGDVPVTYADISKAKRELGYRPVTELKEGLATMWDWIQSCPVR